MRLLILCFFLFSLTAFAQKEVDSASSDTLREDYLIGNIWNGILLSSLDNPALAGFDRRLQISYSYEGERLKVPEGFDTKQPGFWNQIAEYNFAFGGKRRNIGVNVTYNSGQELISNYHRIQLAHSYRLNLKKHKITFGLGVQYLNIKGGANTATYGDQIDPRYGFVYPPFERFRSDDYDILEYSGGITYSWKGFFLGYSFSNEHRSLLTPGGNDLFNIHHTNISYSHYFEQMGHVSIGTTVNYNSFDWYYEPFVVVTWKEHLFASFSAPDIEQVRILFGLSRWGIRLFYSCAFYLNRFAIDNYGTASMQGGLRYHIQPFKTK